MSVIRNVLKNNGVGRCRIFCSQRRTLSEASPYILKSESSDIVVPNISITELLYPKIERFHKYTALESATTGRKYTFGQLRTKCRNLSKSLREKLKLNKGDVVAIMVRNIPEFPIASLGTIEAELIVSTLNPAYTSEEISKQLVDCSAKAIITHADCFSKVQTAMSLGKRHVPIIAIKDTQAESLPQGAINFDELADSKIDVPDFSPGKPDDIVFMPYSSGTTGLPKGVLLSHRNIVINILQANHQDFHYFYQEPSDSYQEIIPGVLPFYHIYGFTMCSVHTAYNGMKVVTMEKFTPDLCISVLQKHPVSVFYVVPPLVQFLTNNPNVKSEYMKHLKFISSGAAPLGYLDEEKLIKKVGKEFGMYQGYGLSETSPMVTYSPARFVRSPKTSGSIGKPVCNTEVKLINPEDPTGTPLGPNETGEILVKGPQVMKSYHNRPEETENAFLDGWFRTGDMAYYNEDRYIFITDRIKELIKVQGFQVAPAELEEIIRHFPAVQDAAVIGIPHATKGEVPRAYVVPKAGVPLKVEELQEYVAKQVTKYKQLAGGVEITDVIPKNASGKILRRQLKQEYAAKNK